MIINLISGPRNVSTALMYSFAQHSKFKVVDEPLYAHYLRITGLKHPGFADILNSLNQDGNQVLKELLDLKETENLFIKNMAHHHMQLDFTYMLNVKNIFLTRDPRDMLPTLIRQIPNPTLHDTAYKRQWELYNFLIESGIDPLVVDARNFLENPKVSLTNLGEALGFSFEESMLSWSKGPKSYDGIWAKYWYHMLHDSVGFKAYEEKRDHFPSELVPLLHECDVYYHRLTDKLNLNYEDA